MTFERPKYDMIYNYLADRYALNEVEYLNQLYMEYIRLEQENRELQDNLAVLHAIITKDDERRRPPEK